MKKLFILQESLYSADNACVALVCVAMGSIYIAIPMSSYRGQFSVHSHVSFVKRYYGQDRLDNAANTEIEFHYEADRQSKVTTSASRNATQPTITTCVLS